MAQWHNKLKMARTPNCYLPGPDPESAFFFLKVVVIYCHPQAPQTAPVLLILPVTCLVCQSLLSICCLGAGLPVCLLQGHLTLCPTPVSSLPSTQVLLGRVTSKMQTGSHYPTGEL